MYSTRAGLILGFHGCDESLVEKVCSGKEELIPSNKEHDWLGDGIYFWENSPQRAIEFATTHQRRLRIKKPAVIGSVINLGYCLDLLDYSNLCLLKEGYNVLKTLYKETDLKLPKNKSAYNKDGDLLLRMLDCKVIKTLHQVKLESKERPFDSVRAVFWEGNELYKGAGFREKNHIQICIRNPHCIKGYFIPRIESNGWAKV